MTDLLVLKVQQTSRNCCHHDMKDSSTVPIMSTIIQYSYLYNMYNSLLQTVVQFTVRKMANFTQFLPTIIRAFVSILDNSLGPSGYQTSHNS